MEMTSTLQIPITDPSNLYMVTDLKQSEDPVIERLACQDTAIWESKGYSE